MYKLLHNSSLPKIIKVLLYILLTLSCIYLIIILLYKLLEILRIIIHFISDKRNWWTFVVCILIVCIGAFIFAQFFLGLDPYGKFIFYIQSLWKDFINSIINLLNSAN